MKTIKLSIIAFAFGILAFAQNGYETEMKSAFENWGKANTPEEAIKASEQFEKIAKSEKQNWIPTYYAVFIRTINAFGQEKTTALESLTHAEELFKTIESESNDELLVLKGLINTVKVAHDPMTKGMLLSGEIIGAYQKALLLNPENPRAMYLLAQYNMKSAQYMGGNPVDYCPNVKKAKTLIVNETKPGFEPVWGEEQINDILNSTCK